MIEQNVQVVRLEGERFWVRMGSQTGCAACDNGQGCGAGLFAKLLKREPVIIELVRKGLKVETGQMITLAFPEHVYMRLVFASYGWPLLAGLVGALAGHSLATWLQFEPLWIDILALIGGLALGVFVMGMIKNLKNTGTYLSSLVISYCYPSAEPHMCNKGLPETSSTGENP